MGIFEQPHNNGVFIKRIEDLRRIGAAAHEAPKDYTERFYTVSKEVYRR